MKPLELCIERKEEFLQVLQECSYMEEAQQRLEVPTAAIRTAAERLKVKVPLMKNSQERSRQILIERCLSVVKLREENKSYAEINRILGLKPAAIRTALIDSRRVDLILPPKHMSDFYIRRSKEIAIRYAKEILNET